VSPTERPRGRDPERRRGGQVEKEIDRGSLTSGEQDDRDRADEICAHPAAGVTESHEHEGAEREGGQRRKGEGAVDRVSGGIPADHVVNDTARSEEERLDPEACQQRYPQSHRQAPAGPAVPEEQVDEDDRKRNDRGLFGEDRERRKEARAKRASPRRPHREHRAHREQDREIVRAVGTCPPAHRECGQVRGAEGEACHASFPRNERHESGDRERGPERRYA